PFPVNLKELKTGEVGFIITGIKGIRDVIVGDTLTHTEKPAKAPLTGFKKLKPMVFSSLFPSDANDFAQLKTALEKLALNDSSLVFETENSPAMGFGFRCGFLGLLHLEIIQERLEREFHLQLVVTAPSVIYKIFTKDGQAQTLDNPSALPDPSKIDRIEEPFVRVSIHTPSEYVGGILKLCEDKRGKQIQMEYSSGNRMIMEYRLPMSEIVIDFHDRLKSISRGYASMEYEWMDFTPSQLVKLDILLNGQKVDALSVILHRSRAQQKGRALVKKLRTLIPRQQYKIAIQAGIGSKVIARETLSALRKDVTAKLYGGDVTRKQKLLEKQKKGKKRMKAIGQVEVPQSAFMAVLKVDD
ncbi:MAG: translation elongation factor 4, partial [Bdellovibrionales bacterium]|nr:translation elongation factor 4 [Bdellovibrionales bacterium]